MLISKCVKGFDLKDETYVRRWASEQKEKIHKMPEQSKFSSLDISQQNNNFNATIFDAANYCHEKTIDLNIMKF